MMYRLQTLHSNSICTTTHWMSALPPGKVAPPALHSVLEKAVVLTRATGQASGAGLSQLAVSYAEVLAGQGQLSTAISYLDMVPDGGDPVTVLRDRIVRGGAAATATTSAPAPAAPAPATPQQVQQAYAGNAYGQQEQQQQQQQQVKNASHRTHHAAPSSHQIDITLVNVSITSFPMIL